MVSLNPFRKSQGNVEIIRPVSDHIEAHLGEMEWVCTRRSLPLCTWISTLCALQEQRTIDT